MPETAIEKVNRIYREFKRYSGDDLPGEPVGAPLPVGDPQSGTWNPKKRDLREALLAPVEAGNAAVIEATEQADRAESEADRSEADAARAQAYAAMLSVDRVKFNTVPALLADETLSYDAGEGLIEVGPGDIVEAGGERFEIEASDASTTLGTAGDIKVNLQSHIFRPAAYGIFSSASDQTGIIQAFVNDAAERGATIEWGRLDAWIDGTGPAWAERSILVPSKSHWVMSSETVLRILPNDQTAYCGFNIYGVSNVIIEGNGARIVGERDEHTDTDGGATPRGIGVNIRGSNNVVISDLSASDCWGDGFYVGSSNDAAIPQLFSQDVHLLRVHGDRNRRQGLSLISAKNLLVQKSSFSNTEGSTPAAGLDIEPNFPTEFLQAIRLEDIYTEANSAAGILIFLIAMQGGNRVVDINISGHHSNRDGAGTDPIYQRLSAFEMRRINRDFYLGGKITYSDGFIEDAGFGGIRVWDKDRVGPFLNVIRPTVVGAYTHGAGGSENGSDSGIAVYRTNSVGDGESPRPTDPGGVLIDSPRVIQKDGGNMVCAYRVLSMSGGGGAPWGHSDVTLRNPVSVGTFPSSRPILVGSEQRNVRVIYDTLPRRQLTVSLTLVDGGYLNHVFHNQGASTLLSVTLIPATEARIGWKFHFQVIAGGQALIVQPNAADRIRPGSPSAGDAISSTTVGSWMTVECMGVNVWAVTQQTGTWAP